MKLTQSKLTFQRVYDLSRLEVPQLCCVVPGCRHQLLPLHQPVAAHHWSYRQQEEEQHIKLGGPGI